MKKMTEKMQKWSVHVAAPRDQWLKLPGLGTAATGHELTVVAASKEEAEARGLAESMYPRGTAHARPRYQWSVKVRFPAVTKRTREVYRSARLRGGMIEEFVVEATDEAMARRAGKVRAQERARSGYVRLDPEAFVVTRLRQA